MINQILELQREKNDKCRVNFIERLSDSLYPETYTITGTYVYYTLKGKIKYVDNASVVWYDDTWLTPGYMARHYLALKYPKGRKRMGRDEFNISHNFKPTPPRYCEPGKVEYGYHIDLKGSYWQIVRAFGWDVSYVPNKYIMVSSNNLDFPFKDHKIARNTLVTTAIGNPMRVWTGKEYATRKAPPQMANPALYRLVQDVQNAIASELIERAKAKYWNVDGGIIRADYIHVAREIFREWGLDWRYQYPEIPEINPTFDPEPLPMTVSHLGDYSNPFKPPHPRHRHIEQPASHIFDYDKFHKVDIGWLKERFRAFRDFHMGVTSGKPDLDKVFA